MRSKGIELFESVAERVVDDRTFQKSQADVAAATAKEYHVRQPMPAHIRE